MSKNFIEKTVGFVVEKEVCIDLNCEGSGLKIHLLCENESTQTELEFGG